jgi:[acyl-carrier-protein] S-malonyltransferase
MTARIAFMFPGQGSQKVGMGQSLVEPFPAVGMTLEFADAVLGLPLRKWMFEGPEETLTNTAVTQPALLALEAGIARTLSDEGVTAGFALGHSLGEYSALVYSRCLTLEEALPTVRERGRLMNEAVPQGQGGMVALIGFKHPEETEVVRHYGAEAGLLETVNFNHPTQVVLAGEAAAVDRATAYGQEIRKSHQRAVKLKVGGPFHSRLMKPVAESLARSHLKSLRPRPFNARVAANLTADFYPSPAQVPEYLEKQIYSPVLWWDEVRAVYEAGARVFVEVGPGRVLSGLLRGAFPDVRIYATDTGESIREVVRELKEVAGVV